MISFLNTKLYQGVHFSFAKYKKKKKKISKDKKYIFIFDYS